MRDRFLRRAAKAGAVTATILVAAWVTSLRGLHAGQDEPQAGLAPSDYGRWETLGRAAALSPDGRWLAVPVSRVDGTSELRLHHLPPDQAGATAFVGAEGGDPAFSDDGQWLAYRVGHSEQEREDLRAKKDPVRDGLGLVRLDGPDTALAVSTIEGVASFAFGNGGRHIAFVTYAPAEGPRKGADLIVRELATGRDASFGNVTEYAWQEDGSLLAMTIAAEGRTGNGVQLLDAATGVLRVLASGDADFSGLAWRDEDDDLGAFRSRTDPGWKEDTALVLIWRDLADGQDRSAGVEPLVYDATEDSALDEDVRVVGARPLSWSGDGTTVFFGIQDRTREPTDSGTSESASPEAESADDAPEPSEPTVDVWHTGDERIVPMQRVQLDRDRRRSSLVAWPLGGNQVVRLSSDLDEQIDPIGTGRFAIETDRKPYLADNMFDRTRHDVYLVDVGTGARQKVIEGTWYYEGASPDGRYLLYFKDDQFWTYDIASRRHTNLTGGLGTSFVNEDYDTPVRRQRPPWGMAGWLNGDRAVLLYDRYDVWRVSPDGSGGERLTRGAEEEVRHRYVRLARDEEAIDGDEPAYFSLYGEWTKKFGYARVAAPGASSPARPERLIWLDKNVGRLLKAEAADVYAYVTQGFDDSPDYFTGGPRLSDARQATQTNPFQSEYAWGRSELVDYRGPGGRRLQGALYYPAAYQPGRRYPLIVYVYERLSQGLHTYVVPSERNAYGTAVFTAEGYFVLKPDIVFRPRDPGVSAVECVTAAVQRVLDTGMVDPKRVGLVGHSWGGYEASFIPTQTNMFAAAVAGAPLTNFFSMFGTIHWNQGMPETQHFETGQARMEVPYWVDHEAYVRNSPVLHITKLRTPMLVFFGDKDGTVDWHQGVEIYNYARRAGKTLVMLVYAGENHSARQKPNQIDYHRRVLQWFGHYLKGAPAADWVTQGVKVIDRERK